MNQVGQLRSFLNPGRMRWSQWLPMASAIFIMLAAVINAVANLSSHPAYDLLGFLNKFEMLLLMVTGALLLSRAGNLVALFALSYLSAKAVYGMDPTILARPIVFLILAALTFSTLLADQLPWVKDGTARIYGHKLRATFGILIGLMGFASAAFCLVKTAAFAKWLTLNLGMSLSPVVLLFLIGLCLLSWLAYLLEQADPIVLMILAIPASLTCAFAVSLPITLAAIPFLCGIAIATRAR